MKFRSLLVSLVVLTCSLFASAQFVYSTNQFSVSFNNTSVEYTTSRSEGGNSTNYVYKSVDTGNTAAEYVVVRIVDHDIAVNVASAEFYRNDNNSGILDTTSNSSGTLIAGGYPYAYGLNVVEKDGFTYWVRTRYIIVSSREVIFIRMFSTKELSSWDLWDTFENTLTIK